MSDEIQITDDSKLLDASPSPAKLIIVCPKCESKSVYSSTTRGTTVCRRCGHEWIFMELDKQPMQSINRKIMPICPQCSGQSTNYRLKTKSHICRRCGHEWVDAASNTIS